MTPAPNFDVETAVKQTAARLKLQSARLQSQLDVLRLRPNDARAWLLLEAVRQARIYRGIEWACEWCGCSESRACMGPGGPCRWVTVTPGRQAAWQRKNGDVRAAVDIPICSACAARVTADLDTELLPARALSENEALALIGLLDGLLPVDELRSVLDWDEWRREITFSLRRAAQRPAR